MIDQHLVLRIAKELSIHSEDAERLARMSALLGDLSQHPATATALALKGGTALNLTTVDPPRLSLDLDFNYVGEIERNAMLEARPGIEAAIEAITEARGYRLDASTDEHAGATFVLRYDTIDDNPDRLSIDLNFLHRVALLPLRSVEYPRPGGSKVVVCQTMSFEELAAGKLVACVGRAEPRDLWDVAALPTQCAGDWPPPLLRACFVFLAGSLAKSLPSYSLDRLKRFSDRDLERRFHPLLRRARPSAADLVEAALAVLGPLMELTPNEIEFSERLQHGELDPGLLFEDDALVDKAGRHPVLLWKVLNARKRKR